MKYSLRSLFVVVFLVALCAGWLADHVRLAKEVDRLQQFEGRWRAKALSLIDIMNNAGWKAEINDDGNFTITYPSADSQSLPAPSAPAPKPSKQ
jgi:hypothetical protein